MCAAMSHAQGLVDRAHERKEKSQMKKHLQDYSFANLAPAGEIKETEMKADDHILMNNKAA